MKHLINCRNAALAYDGCTVVENLTFTVDSGDYLCIVGENGSGKTTLMKALLGLLRPVSGTIEYSDTLGRNEIGYLPQHANIQPDFPASVREIILSGTLGRHGFLPFYSAQDRERAEQSMELLSISHLASRSFQHLSGGQQQRVLLARALCATSRLLLMDEPAAGLDPAATDEMYSVIRMLNREKGITIIMISHDLGAVAADSTHVLHLHHEPLFFGKTRDYYAADIAKTLRRGCAQ